MKTRKPYKQIEYADRIRIDLMLRKGFHKKEIAAEIGCTLASIYNELKRSTYVHTNPDLTTEIRYNPIGAQELIDFNKSGRGPKLKIDKDYALAEFIERKIHDEKYSPEAVLLYIKNHPDECKFSVDIKSVNTIYSYIDKGVFLSLKRKHLPCGHRYKNKGKRREEQKRIVHRKQKTDNIEKRPKEVNDREQFGHWEMDTVKSGQKDKTAVLVLTERKTRFEIVEPLRQATTDEVRKALNRIEKSMGSRIFHIMKTVTCDNGSEFQDYESIEKALYRVGNRTKLFYCHPYSSYERGSNENANKLIRRHVPKGFSFGSLTRAEVKEIQEWINHYPRRMFGGKSSSEMFLREMTKLELVC